MFPVFQSILDPYQIIIHAFVNRDLVENRGHLDHKVSAENAVKQDLRALKVTEASSVCRVFPALL